MIVQPYKTKIFYPPQDELLQELFIVIPYIPEHSIIAMTAKVVSIDQGRCVKIGTIAKDELIKRESDFFLSRNVVPGGYVMHTITNHTLIPSAGIDTSNGGGWYVLWPNNIKKTLVNYYKKIKKQYKLREFGILITDSRSNPLRRGTVGISVGSIGFKVVNDYRGKKDIFGKEMISSQVNVPDSLAAAATATIGEGREQTPIALLSDLPFVHFGSDMVQEKHHSTYEVSKEDDIYKPFIDLEWHEGGHGVIK